MKYCVVSYIDFDGIRHSAEVHVRCGGSGTGELSGSRLRPGWAHELEVQVRTTVTHSLSVKKLGDWANRSAASPRDMILKKRIKAALPKTVRSPESGVRSREG
jgi:hypothetical protein